MQPSAVAVIAWLFSTYYIILQERRGCLEAIDAMTEYPRRTRAAREPYATNTNSCKKRFAGWLRGANIRARWWSNREASEQRLAHCSSQESSQKS